MEFPRRKHRWIDGTMHRTILALPFRLEKCQDCNVAWKVISIKYKSTGCEIQCPSKRYPWNVL